MIGITPMRIVSYTVIFLFLFTSGICGSLLYIIHNTELDKFTLYTKHRAKPTILLDDQGNEWARFELYHSNPIALTEIPLSVINAFIAAEDHHFFKHPGISWRGIIRSLLVNIYNQRKIQGASTITQQLTRLLFFNNQKTFLRKIKEQFYALLLESNFTKKQILENYLNHIYLGCGIYGIQAACQKFWHKPIEAIELHEAATLAAIIKSPAHYCPLLNKQQAQKRRNLVLHSMLQLNFITSQEYENALQKPVLTFPSHESIEASHLKETIRVTLEKLVGKHILYKKGFTVQTTLNTSMQKTAFTVFTHHIKTLQKDLRIPLDGAVVTLDVQTSAIKSLIGGYDFTSSHLNRALHIKRPIGSLIKPLIYALAIDKGYSLVDIQIDEPFEINFDNQKWAPRNVTRTFQGSMTLAQALATSNNIIAVKLLLEIGVNSLVDLLKKCHLGNDIAPYPSLALGCLETSPVKTAAMFNIFAHNGIYHEPYVIEWIKDSEGKKIYKHISNSEQILTWQITSQINSVLYIHNQRLQKRLSISLACDSIGKTGTTNDSRTCLFTGSTPDFTTTIYLGCDNNQALPQVLASTTAFPLWLDLHKQLPCSNTSFMYDPQLEKIVIHPLTGEKTLNGITLLVSPQIDQR